LGKELLNFEFEFHLDFQQDKKSLFPAAHFDGTRMHNEIPDKSGRIPLFCKEYLDSGFLGFIF